MPVAPYDTLESVLNTARVRLNDAIVVIGGDILTDVQAFTGAIVNAAWRRMQELLANSGFAALNREATFASVPAAAAGALTDQGIRVWFNWVNYYDGVTTQAAPVLPQDMICPLDLFERVHGATATNYWPMDQVYNGLPTAPRGTLNRLWEWRQETIYMQGATGITDIMLRYAAFLSDFTAGLQTTLSGNITNVATSVPVVSGANIANGNYIQVEAEMMLVAAGGGTTTLTVTRNVLGTANVAHASGVGVYVSPIGLPVPIMRCLSSFAWFICSETAHARGDLDAGMFDAQAIAAAEMIYNRDPRQARSIAKRSEYGKMKTPETPTQGPAGPRGSQQGG